MQEEVNQKVISLSIQGVKITASVLKAALRKFLEMDNRRKQKATQVKMAEKTGRAQEKGREKARKKIEKKKPHGKQTIKQLNAQGVQLSNLKITDENIKSFDRVARKYGIDYSLKKEVGADPPKYLVFFKAKDVDVMTAAFREYAGVELKKKQVKKPSVRKKLQKSVERKAKHRQRADPNHLRVEDPGQVEGNPVFIYLDAFSKPEYFAEFLPEYSGMDELKEHYTRGGLGDVKVKKFLNNVLQAELAPIRERRKMWEQKLPDVYDILKAGSKKARETAGKTLEDVRRSMKIDYFDNDNLLKM